MASNQASSSERVPVIIMGLGVIGRSIASAALQAPGLEVIGAIDPQFVGQRLGDLVGKPDASPVTVVSELGGLARAARGGVVLHATGSYLHRVQDQLEACAKARLNVVSTCEELAYPWLYHPERARSLDRQCTDYGVAMVGTGVNPGFVFERLSSIMSQVTGQVRRVDGTRVVDATTRRHALQLKTGAGLSPAQFKERAEGGGFGHVGLRASAALLALGCGLGAVDSVVETLEPVIATRVVDGAVTVQPGEVSGIRQVARAQQAGREVVCLDLTIALRADNPHDTIRLDCDPPLQLTVTGGTPGDSATAWTAVHAATQLGTLTPGLKTVLDLPTGRRYQRGGV